MAEMKDLIFHGVRQQISRVLTAMGEKRVLDGISAFEDGASNWSACFFARAYPEINLHRDPENQIAELLGMGQNKVPMRIVYRTFDGMNITMKKPELLSFCRGFLDKQRDPGVEAAINAVLSGIDYKGAEDAPIDFAKCEV